MFRKLSTLIAALFIYAVQAFADTPQRWSEAKAEAWYAEQPWLVGANYLPKDAVNEFEMWQAASFNPAEIDRELGLAESIGMNTMRVFLHDKLWAQDPKGFKARISVFLGIAAKHHIRPLLVLLDSCWDPDPQLGPQRPPIPGVHNSGWAQSPGEAALADPSTYPRIEAYVKGVVGAFAKDPRILGWDVWNEPDNLGGGTYKHMAHAEKIRLVAALLPQVFQWARSTDPVQPLTSGVWNGPNWAPDAAGQNAVVRVQLEQSDVISFHSYEWPEALKARIAQLRAHHRPLFLTEYMARGNGSLFDLSLPIGKAERIAMFNWGFVAGKSQTSLPWDSWQKPYIDREPTIWFHDIFRDDLTPYRQEEVDLIKRLTSQSRAETH